MSQHKRPKDQIVGWYSGQKRPFPGLRVRMAAQYSQEGSGTIIKVVDTGLTHPSTTVRWDGGKVVTYHSAASLSRDALSRSIHPMPTRPLEQKLQEYMKDQQWDLNLMPQVWLSLKRYAAETVLLDEDEPMVDLNEINSILGDDVTKDQLMKLSCFAIEVNKPITRQTERRNLRLIAHGAGHDLNYQQGLKGYQPGMSLPLVIAKPTSTKLSAS